MVWPEEGERKRSRRGQQRPPLTASLGADRLGGRPAGSRVRARCPGPDFRLASESYCHCAETGPVLAAEGCEWEPNPLGRAAESPA